MQPLKRNLFGAEKAICNQDSEFKNRSESNIDKFSLPTSPVASQVPVRPIATEPNDGMFIILFLICCLQFFLHLAFQYQPRINFFLFL